MYPTVKASKEQPTMVIVSELGDYLPKTIAVVHNHRRFGYTRRVLEESFEGSIDEVIQQNE